MMLDIYKDDYAGDSNIDIGALPSPRLPPKHGAIDRGPTTRATILNRQIHTRVTAWWKEVSREKHSNDSGIDYYLPTPPPTPPRTPAPTAPNSVADATTVAPHLDDIVKARDYVQQWRSTVVFGIDTHKTVCAHGTRRITVGQVVIQSGDGLYAAPMSAQVHGNLSPEPTYPELEPAILVRDFASEHPSPHHNVVHRPAVPARHCSYEPPVFYTKIASTPSLIPHCSSRGGSEDQDSPILTPSASSPKSTSTWSWDPDADAESAIEIALAGVYDRYTSSSDNEARADERGLTEAQRYAREWKAVHAAKQFTTPSQRQVQRQYLRDEKVGMQVKEQKGIFAPWQNGSICTPTTPTQTPPFARGVICPELPLCASPKTLSESSMSSSSTVLDTRYQSGLQLRRIHARI